MFKYYILGSLIASVLITVATLFRDNPVVEDMYYINKGNELCAKNGGLIAYSYSERYTCKDTAIFHSQKK